MSTSLCMNLYTVIHTVINTVAAISTPSSSSQLRLNHHHGRRRGRDGHFASLILVILSIIFIFIFDSSSITVHALPTRDCLSYTTQQGCYEFPPVDGEVCVYAPLGIGCDCAWCFVDNRCYNYDPCRNVTINSNGDQVSCDQFRHDNTTSCADYKSEEKINRIGHSVAFVLGGTILLIVNLLAIRSYMSKAFPHACGGDTPPMLMKISFAIWIAVYLTLGSLVIIDSTTKSRGQYDVAIVLLMITLALPTLLGLAISIVFLIAWTISFFVRVVFNPTASRWYLMLSTLLICGFGGLFALLIVSVVGGIEADDAFIVSLFVMWGELVHPLYYLKHKLFPVENYEEVRVPFGCKPPEEHVLLFSRELSEIVHYAYEPISDTVLAVVMVFLILFGVPLSLAFVFVEEEQFWLGVAGLPAAFVIGMHLQHTKFRNSSCAAFTMLIWWFACATLAVLSLHTLTGHYAADMHLALAIMFALPTVVKLLSQFQFGHHHSPSNVQPYVPSGRYDSLTSSDVLFDDLRGSKGPLQNTYQRSNQY
jgi:hypothetical protein